jgi:predicted RNA-binding protein YlqC (UPF0109 family)
MLHIRNKETTMEFKDQEFVEYLVKSIVSHPEDVSTVRSVDEMGVLITLKINREDMGYVIGRQGQTARAIRHLLKIVGARHNARVNLKIEEPEGSNYTPSEKKAPVAEVEEVEIDTAVIDDLTI